MSDWRSLTQDQLDWSYDQRQHAPNMGSIMEGLASASARAQARLPQRQRLSYGEADIEAVDWYPCGRPDAPLLFFVHGGAWRSGLARDYAFFVEWVLQRGLDVAIADFSAVTEVDGELGVLEGQVAAALKRVLALAPGRALHLSGHSSGAHLAACVATRPDFAGRLTSLVVCSGMYDLEPVSLSSRSRYVRFTPALVRSLSPIRRVQDIGVPVKVLCGSRESPEFVRQAQAFAHALQAAGKSVHLAIGEGLNHFEILETLAGPEGFFSELLQQTWSPQ